jgi:enoyl-CoA hydratase
MELHHFRLDVDAGIATVTFDRPPVNAQTRETREELIGIFDALSDREDVRVVILTGAGTMFSAGADIKERIGMAHEPGDYIRHNRLTREFFYAVSDCTKPVIAAVNGPALGAGLVLMFACDIMMAADEAWFAMPEVDVGLAGGARWLSGFLGRSAARAMYLTGRHVTAAEFHRLGVIEPPVPRAHLLDAAREMARTIAAKSPVAVKAIKRALNAAEEMPARDAYRYEQTITIDLSQTVDAREAQRAFVEKRKPRFTGR